MLFRSLLKHALTPKDEPDIWLNQKIVRQAKEREDMRENTKKTMRRVPAAALAAAIVLGCGSITAFAAWKYLSPQNVAEEFGQTKLADAFAKGDAVLVNETQSYGEYDVTLMGLISGKDLSVNPTFDEEGVQLELDKTYSVVAIKHADGTPMAKTSEDAYADMEFFVSPLIRGLDPVWYNAFTMSGGYQEMVEDGILYRIAECDNVEKFADRGLYLCVLDSTFYNNEAYQFDKESGEITRNEAYSGLNALFQLPIDASAADPEAAKAYIDQMEQELFGDEQQEDGKEQEAVNKSQGINTVAETIKKITEENIDQYAKKIANSVQICKPDQENNISYKFKQKGGGGTKGKMRMSDCFSGDEKFKVGGYWGSDDSYYMETFLLNEDGTVTYTVYKLK